MQKDIKNIIFDLGGVLVGLDPERCVHAFRTIGAGEVAVFVAEHRVESLFFDAEIGNISQHEFCSCVRRLTNSNIPDERIVWAWNELLTGIADAKKERLLQLADRYRLFLLSNTNVMHWEKCAEDFFPYEGHGVDDFFREVFLSYEMHLIKPSEDIFREVLRRANIRAEETLFVDDSAENCAAARRLGMRALHNEGHDDWLNLLH